MGHTSENILYSACFVNLAQENFAIIPCKQSSQFLDPSEFFPGYLKSTQWDEFTKPDRKNSVFYEYQQNFRFKLLYYTFFGLIECMTTF